MKLVIPSTNARSSVGMLDPVSWKDSRSGMMRKGGGKVRGMDEFGGGGGKR